MTAGITRKVLAFSHIGLQHCWKLLNGNYKAASYVPGHVVYLLLRIRS